MFPFFTKLDSGISSFENESCETIGIANIFSFFDPTFVYILPEATSVSVISSMVVEVKRQVSASAVGRKKPKPPTDVAMTVIGPYFVN